MSLVDRLRALGSPEKAAGMSRYFQTGPGQYAEGDQFLGINVPTLRKMSRQLWDLPLEESLGLLHSPFHEARCLALMIWSQQSPKNPQIYPLYLANTGYVNNWDLVDGSAPAIVGAHLWDKPRAQLDTLSRSASLWERRIAIVATFYFIKKLDFADTLKISENLLCDHHDLIHKAVGWMLREVGKRDLACEEAFLLRHYKAMPRTMLRYAIERFPEPRRRAYLAGTC